MNPRKSVQLLVALFTAWCWQPVQAAATTWKAGATAVNITPEKFIWMAGYGARTKPAEGKFQDLYAKVLVLEDEQRKRLVFVTTDLVGISHELRAGVEKKIMEQFQIPREGLLMNASHTHSGPELRSNRALPQRAREAEEYARALEFKIVAAIGAALKKLEPANVSYAFARAGFAMNRRRPTDKGIINAPYPDGPVDHTVPVLRVESPTGELKSVMFGYACHNTTMSGYEWSGDYAGFAQEYLQEKRPGVVALFLMGAGGDQNPYPRRPSEAAGATELDLARQHGRALANAVEVALHVPQRAVTGPLLLAYDHVRLDFTDPKREPAHYPVQVIKFGSSLTLVALTSEVVIDYALRLKRELAADTAVWVAAYSNDSLSYIPSLRVQREGGYETRGGYADTTEERIMAKVHELHGRLRPPTPMAAAAGASE
jgi:hypothetical protein